LGLAGGYIAEAAISAANRAQKQKGCRARIEAFPPVGTIDLFANGMQFQTAQLFPDRMILVASERRHFQPVRTALIFVSHGRLLFKT
jgi:hypothetical protein